MVYTYLLKTKYVFFTMQKQFDCVKIQDVWRNARGYIFGFAIYYIDFLYCQWKVSSVTLNTFW